MPPVASKQVKSTGARSARGERARARLKAAALVVLEREGYHRMRIADVTREAGVAQGLFYHYFTDLKSLTLEVLTEFAQASQDPAEIERDVARGDWYGRIYAYNLVVVRSYARRPGIMRCSVESRSITACLRAPATCSAKARPSRAAVKTWAVPNTSASRGSLGTSGKS